MGISRDVTTFTKKLQSAGKVIGEQGDRKSLLPVARTVQATLDVSAATAGLRKGSRIAGKPWRGTYIRNQGTNELAVGYSSPAHLVNNTNRSHIIGARKLGTKKRISKQVLSAQGPVGLVLSDTRQGAKALHWPGHFARYVHHPGSRGKRFYERAKPVAQKEGGAVFQSTVHRALARVFE